jgi:hypothetical protein
MAGLIEEHICNARRLLEEAEAEYGRAWQEKGLGVIIAWRKSYERGWLAVLQTMNAFFLKQGVPQDELRESDPSAQQELDHLVVHYLMPNESMYGYYAGLLFGYRDRGYDFERMPDLYFKRIKKFIDRIEATPVQDTKRL